MKKSSSSKKPWKRPAPKKTKRTALTSKSRAKAKASARKAGRRYPNLVDNMRAAKSQKKSAVKKKRS